MARYRSRRRRHGEQLRPKRLARIVQADQRIEFRRAAARRRIRAARFAAERLVEVVREDVELAARVAVDVVVAGARPVAVAVDERDVEREEPKRAVDVENRLERRLELAPPASGSAPCRG